MSLWQVDKAKLIGAIKGVLFNQFLGFLLTVVLYPFYLRCGGSFGSELPTFQWVLVELLVFILVEEVGFYYSHRFVALLFPHLILQDLCCRGLLVLCLKCFFITLGSTFLKAYTMAYIINLGIKRTYSLDNFL